MPFNRFHPSCLCVETDLEELLIRINVAGWKSPVPVLCYLLEVCRRLKPAAIPFHTLDTPLNELASVVQEILGQHPSLSVNSVAMYLDDLRYQLNRRPPASGFTTLRAHLPHDDGAALGKMISQAARRIQRVRLRWNDENVFELFARARRKDVFVYFRARFWLDQSVADDATNDTFVRVQCKLPIFDPARGRLVEFTFNEAWYVKQDYLRQIHRRLKRTASLENADDDLSLLEMILAAPVSREVNRKRYAVKLRLIRLLFRLPKPPHQIMAFIRGPLLGRKPLEVLQRYGGLPLRAVADLIEPEFQRVSEAPEHVVRAGFRKLRARMDLTLAELVNGDVRQAAYGDLLHRRAGDIPFREYFPGADKNESARLFVQAWYSVMKALVSGSRGW